MEAFRDPAQIFYQHYSERDGYGPQFADSERLYALISRNKPAKHFRFETAIRVSHERPSHAENARIPLQMPGSQFRQLFIKPDREVIANFAQLFFDDVKVVNQPFRSGRDRVLQLNGLRRGAVIFQQYAAVLGYAGDKRATIVVIGGDSLSGSETLGMLFQTLDAEEFGADRLMNFNKYILRLSGRGHFSLRILVAITRRLRVSGLIEYNLSGEFEHLKAT